MYTPRLFSWSMTTTPCDPPAYWNWRVNGNETVVTKPWDMGPQCQ
jgi:hypothetical protein